MKIHLAEEIVNMCVQWCTGRNGRPSSAVHMHISVCIWPEIHLYRNEILVVIII